MSDIVGLYINFLVDKLKNKTEKHELFLFNIVNVFNESLI